VPPAVPAAGHGSGQSSLCAQQAGFAERTGQKIVALIGFRGGKCGGVAVGDRVWFDWEKSSPKERKDLFVMAVSDLINLSALLDEAKCFELVRQHRWPNGVRCAGCDSTLVIRNGHDEHQSQRQRYGCKACRGRFDDLSGTVLAGHHQPLRVWVLCLYLMGLNLSNHQIAAELDLSASDVQAMTEHLRHGLVARTPTVKLEGEVEIDEVYIVAGHKGQPAEVTKRGGWDDAAGSKVRLGAARWRKTSRQSSA
jgi:transposase-like protein